AVLVLLAGADRAAVVIDTEAHDRPAVIAAFADDVDLIAAFRAVLLLPQFVRPRIEREPFRISRAVGPDLRRNALLADKGIVRRRFSVRRDADDLADGVHEVLRFLRLEVIAERDEQIAVARLH